MTENPEAKPKLSRLLIHFFVTANIYKNNSRLIGK
jgi:hypothetical protein